jgi:hypothetical protein
MAVGGDPRGQQDKPLTGKSKITDPFGIHDPNSQASKITDPLGINAPPATADITALKDQAAQGQSMGAQLDNERYASPLDKTDQTQSAAGQAAAIARLRAAAAGTAPSAAQTQLQSQAAIDAARQTGMARALGGHSAGGSAYRAAVGAANTHAAADVTGRILGAQEQATARDQLATALGAERTQDTSAYKNDVDERNNLLAAQLAQQQTQQQLAAAQAQANAIAAGGENAKNAAVIGAAGAGAGQVLSDERAKTDINIAGYLRRRAA